jgi:predicted metal-dependent hydrolase
LPIETLSRHVAEAHRDILRQDVERFRLSSEQHEKRHGERRDMLLRLEIELQAAGAQGLEERRAELARDLPQAERRCKNTSTVTCNCCSRRPVWRLTKISAPAH